MIPTIEFPEKFQALFQPARYKVFHSGRDGGKSWSIGRALLLKAASKKLRILCARETQKSIRDSVHKLIGDQIARMSLLNHFLVYQTAITSTIGSEFSFAGISDQTAESIKSFEGIDICWVEEAQKMTARSWDILTKTIRKQGSEIWITFNPELDTDETWKRFVENPYPGSVVVGLTYRDNPWHSETMEQERLRDKEMLPAVEYEWIWEGKCRPAVQGAIYTNEVRKLIDERRYRPVPYDPMLPVHTVWDLGWNDKMAIILAQRLGAEIRILEYIEDSHRTLADYVADFNDREYQWGQDWLPHDGGAKDFKTGKSAQEILHALGRKQVRIVPNVAVEQGIKSTRLVMPRIYLNEDKGGARLLECLRRYRRSIPSNTGEPSAPLHDEFSHGADALRYLALCADQMVNEQWGSNGMNKAPALKYPKRAYA